MQRPSCPFVSDFPLLPSLHRMKKLSKLMPSQELILQLLKASIRRRKLHQQALSLLARVWIEALLCARS